MAANRRFHTTDTIRVAVPAGTVSGDPVRIGAFLSGVALDDRSADGDATVQIAPGSVYALPVVAASALGSPITGVAVTFGDRLYIDSSTGTVSKTSSGTPFGVALGNRETTNSDKRYYPSGTVIESGETDTIDVLLIN